jgi:hypothetical protein
LQIKLVKQQIKIKLPKRQRWIQLELANQIAKTANQIGHGKSNCLLKQKESGQF